MMSIYVITLMIRHHFKVAMRSTLLIARHHFKVKMRSSLLITLMTRHHKVTMRSTILITRHHLKGYNEVGYNEVSVIDYIDAKAPS